MKQIVTTVLAVMLSFAAVPATAEVTGTWLLEVETPRGTNTPTLTIVEQDGHYSGTMAGRRGSQEIETIAVDGATFSFELNVTMPFGTMRMTYAGTVDGDDVAGQIGNPRGTIPFVGTRQAVD